MTAMDYDDLLTRLYVIDALPAWETNGLKRLTRTAKRYIAEPALIAAALRLDVAGVLADGDCSDGCWTPSLPRNCARNRRCPSRPRLHHLRTQSTREELDIVAELRGERVMAWRSRPTRRLAGVPRGTWRGCATGSATALWPASYCTPDRARSCSTNESSRRRSAPSGDECPWDSRVDAVNVTVRPRQGQPCGVGRKGWG